MRELIFLSFDPAEYGKWEILHIVCLHIALALFMTTSIEFLDEIS